MSTVGDFKARFEAALNTSIDSAIVNSFDSPLNEAKGKVNADSI